MCFVSNLIARADRFAEQAHGSIGQLRKYSGAPYITHPRAVARLVMSVPHTEIQVAAALLHDVVEDTPFTLKQIERAFGRPVARMVDELTERRLPNTGNRATRQALEVERLSSISAEAMTVKVADIIDNASAIFKYDKSFAPLYLLEKRNQLQSLSKADQDLLLLGSKTIHEAILAVQAETKVSHKS